MEGFSEDTISELKNKFKKDDIVYEIIRPYEKLVIQSINGKICHCLIQENPERKALVFLERELKSWKLSSDNT